MSCNFETIKEKNLFPIFPVDENKKPLVKWSDEETHIKNREELEKEEKKYNAYGLVTGAKSDLMVIDVDFKKNINGHETFRELIKELNIQKEELKTLTVRTPNDGLHLIFKYKEGLKNVANILSGIDIRTDGGYIVAPGSFIKRRDGKIGTYQVIVDSEIAEIPQKLFEYLKNKAKDNKNNKVGRPTTMDSTYNRQVSEGGRNEALFKYICRMIRFIKEPIEVREIAKMYNATKMNPPLTEEEVNKIIESALSYMTKPYLDDNRNILVGHLVDYILENNNCYSKGNNIYFYNEKLGYYEYKGDKDLQRMYYDIVKKDANKESINYKKCETFTKTLFQACLEDKECYEHDKKYICCSNGVINVEKNELLSYDPKYKLDCKFNGNFNPNKEAVEKSFNESKFRGLLKDILEDDDKIQTLQDLWGAMLMPRADKTQSIYIYLGSGSNGKSSIFKIQESLFYDKERSISNLQLDQFGKTDGFMLSITEGKKVNIVHDDPGCTDLGKGIFKSMVCAEPVPLNVKYKNPKQLTINMAWFYALNDLPNTNDKSWGFYRRNGIIPFEITFGTLEEVERGEADIIKEPGIVEDIIENEIDIIFNWAYLGLKRMMKNNYQPTLNKASIKATKEYREDTDSVYSFVQYGCEKKSGAKIKSKDLYNAYLNWCENELRSSVNITNFGKQVKNLGIKHKRGEQGIQYFGIAIKKEFEECPAKENPFLKVVKK